MASLGHNELKMYTRESWQQLDIYYWRDKKTAGHSLLKGPENSRSGLGAHINNSCTNCRILGAHMKNSSTNCRILGAHINNSCTNCRILEAHTNNSCRNCRILGAHINNSCTNCRILGAHINNSCMNCRILGAHINNNCTNCRIVLQRLHKHYLCKLPFSVADVFLKHTISKIHGANLGPIWVLLAPDRPHVGLMNLAILDTNHLAMIFITQNICNLCLHEGGNVKLNIVIIPEKIHFYVTVCPMEYVDGFSRVILID